MGDWPRYLCGPGGTRIYRVARGLGWYRDFRSTGVELRIFISDVNRQDKSRPRRLYDRFDWWHSLVTVGCLLFMGRLALGLWTWVLSEKMPELEGISWIFIAVLFTLPSLYLLRELWRQARLFLSR